MSDNIDKGQPRNLCNVTNLGLRQENVTNRFGRQLKAFWYLYGS